jgi:hypothetical protein
MSGKAPAEASQRSAVQLRDRKDPLRPLNEIVEGRYSLILIDAVEKGLRILPDDRPKSIKDWLQLLPKMKSHPSIVSDKESGGSDREIEKDIRPRREIDRTIKENVMDISHTTESAAEATQQKITKKIAHLVEKIFLVTVGLLSAIFSLKFLLLMISGRNHRLIILFMLLSGLISFAAFRRSIRKPSSRRKDRYKSKEGVDPNHDILSKAEALKPPIASKRTSFLVKKIIVGALICLMALLTIACFALVIKGRYMWGGVLTLCFLFLTYVSYDITR